MLLSHTCICKHYLKLNFPSYRLARIERLPYQIDRPYSPANLRQKSNSDTKKTTWSTSAQLVIYDKLVAGVFTGVPVYVCMRACRQASMRVSACVPTSVCTRVYRRDMSLCACMYLSVHACVSRVLISVGVYKCTCAYLHTYVYACVRA